MIDKRAIEIWKEAGFAEAGIDALIEAEDRLARESAWAGALALSPMDGSIPAAELKAGHAALAEKTGLAESVIDMLHLALYLPELERAYAGRALPRDVFVDAARDLKFKMDEAWETEGHYGTHAFMWHVPFFRFGRYALGRLQYEDRVYPGPDYECGGVKVTHGETYLGMHIPSGSPLTREACLASLKKAFDFYGRTAEKPLIVHCNSWLLSPDHRVMLGKDSGIVRFIDMFHPIASEEYDSFANAWRVFGRPAKEQRPVTDWPTDTRLRRAYVDWLLAGKKVHSGSGVLIFDGETLLTAR